MQVRMVRGILTRSGAAGAINCGILFQPPSDIWTASSFHMWWEPALATTAIKVPWKDIGGGANWWTLPPGWAVHLRHEGVLAGDSVVLTLAVLGAPTGFKLW